VLQRDAVHCSVLQCVLQCVAVCVAICCDVLQYFAVFCSVLHGVAVGLQRVLRYVL